MSCLRCRGTKRYVFSGIPKICDCDEYQKVSNNKKPQAPEPKKQIILEEMVKEVIEQRKEDLQERAQPDEPKIKLKVKKRGRPKKVINNAEKKSD
jgi:hypothetical protein